jgi:hypothetical protein
MQIRHCLSAIAALAVLSAAAGAQTAPDSAASTANVVVTADTTAPARTSVESSMDRTSAVKRAVPAPAPFAPAPQATAGLGRAKAMMIVGGAAMIAGALVGDDTGRIIMVGGAVVGLYGLWLYLQ